MNNFYYLLVFAVFLTGCTSEGGDKVVKELDNSHGFESFVLGDSLYSRYFASHKKEADDYDVIEVEVLGDVLSTFEDIDSPQKFVYNSEVGSVYSRSINGKIFWYQIGFGDIDSLAYSELRDSLSSKYGKPNSKLDTTISHELYDSTGVDYEGYRWKGDKVWLQLMSGVSSRLERVWITITDRGLLKRWLNVGQRVDSLAKARKISPLTKVGEFPLLSTKEHPMVRVITEPSTLGDGTRKEYKVSYDRYLKPFLGIDNARRFSSGGKVINAEATFGWENDSLSTLKILVEEEKYDPDEMFDSSTFSGFYDLKNSVENQIGKPSVIIEERTKSKGDQKVYHWYGAPFSVEIRQNYITEEKEVAFMRNKKKGYRGVLSESYLGEKDFQNSLWK